MALWTCLIMTDENKGRHITLLKRTFYQEVSSLITSLTHLSATEILACQVQFSYFFYRLDFISLLKASDIPAFLVRANGSNLFPLDSNFYTT